MTDPWGNNITYRRIFQTVSFLRKWTCRASCNRWGAIVPVVELSAGAGLLLLLDGDVPLGWTEALVRFQVDMSKAKAKLEAPGVG